MSYTISLRNLIATGVSAIRYGWGLNTGVDTTQVYHGSLIPRAPSHVLLPGMTSPQIYQIWLPKIQISAQNHHKEFFAGCPMY